LEHSFCSSRSSEVWSKRHFHQARNAIAREKQIKSWTRAKRLALIKIENPTWQDLTDGWGEKVELQISRRAK
jgi:predicted GIY-YIG superfamily endonuclease